MHAFTKIETDLSNYVGNVLECYTRTLDCVSTDDMEAADFVDCIESEDQGTGSFCVLIQWCIGVTAVEMDPAIGVACTWVNSSAWFTSITTSACPNNTVVSNSSLL